jgi:formylglycine-generating enzyme required for sulfatase activity
MLCPSSKVRSRWLSALILLICLWPCIAAAENRLETLVNSLGMEFVRIPAGDFTMGSPVDEPHRSKWEQAHPVVIDKPFYLQISEVTLGQWQAMMGSGFFLRWLGDKTLPATKISWFDANKFIQKLNARGNGTYRLPTEAEWEYAARAGTRSAYPWGDRIDCSRAMYAGSYYGESGCMEQRPGLRTTQESPAPVKSFAPNAWGLYDMHGNVWEWVQDWFGPYPQTRQIDPQGPDSGTERVLRGGSWFDPGHACRSANRAHAHPASRLHTTGFRLVFTPEP